MFVERATKLIINNQLLIIVVIKQYHNRQHHTFIKQDFKLHTIAENVHNLVTQCHYLIVYKFPKSLGCNGHQVRLVKF